MTSNRDAEFRAFLTARWKRLMGTAYLLTNDPHEAEDLAQLAMEKLYSAWPRLGADANVDAYVRRILVNTHLSRVRRRRVIERLTSSPPERGTPDLTGQADDRLWLRSLLATLPPRQRAAVVLRFWEDLSEDQVAHVLGCSVGNVKSQVSRGLAKLREHPEMVGRMTPAMIETAKGTG